MGKKRVKNAKTQESNLGPAVPDIKLNHRAVATFGECGANQLIFTVQCSGKNGKNSS